MKTPFFATLDFEASSLNEHGFPIEVACVVGTARRPVLQFSTLIQPAAHWNMRKGWSTASEAIHGIAAAELAHGMPVDAVCDMLNVLLRDMQVSVDGGTFDEFWLQRLFQDRDVSFRLDHLSGIAPAAFNALKQQAAPQHRAMPDAIWLFEALGELSEGLSGSK